ncbi:respiratory nitrate reductase subunit gamma [Streptomyces acidiscabies]|uniref:Nitrate reductase-like protein NarX n=1 Tax=Streptomyces acidiscabies TaxID=42234 RepID=A0AAP6BLA1_9ACTN|nr:respiratory nitrate reductase subunit gamma [Streptomyces acidiscabies]MBP5942554.1 respiratory nitrate reductase subunit gamma [Streptomyces sp. LBUM 1476]MBZ3917685.1 respiratory nitrate reductase subunit gamma [Streptomyces acidiscabies]MDX2966750.1 respiratory nitrate reductase subunit gamma [Streptomyces acidiscabies]MDX3025191.1 respiratory nitrate reductase subunit gamma [Streptomyces acidiscabies]MDX3796758.1 respiratory nitrate reductase subunit gamma [Streptomyces acidiscabies]
MNVSTSGLLLWVALPYACLAVFAAGHVWRYRHDQFGWTTHTSQLLEHRWLRWGSPLFHLGAFLVIAGHVVGLAVPAAWTASAGISEHAYHTVAVWLGSAAGLAMVTGLGLLCARRLLARRIRLTTDRSDRLLFPLLALTVLLGIAATSAHNVFGPGYDYRESVSLWFRGVFTLRPRPSAISEAPLLFRLHALSACLLFAVWPFTRLVHVWSAPVGYLARPYLVYRRRATRAA